MRLEVAILVIQEDRLSVHFSVRFEPQPGKEDEFRRELLRVVEVTRTESGCRCIYAFESLREPRIFSIQSEWIGEEAFEAHAQYPHTLAFLGAAETLLTHPVQGLRSRLIGGGDQAG